MLQTWALLSLEFEDFGLIIACLSSIDTRNVDVDALRIVARCMRLARYKMHIVVK